MPTSTLSYPFEQKIFAMARSLPIGPEMKTGITYLLVLERGKGSWDDLTARSIFSEPQGDSWDDFMKDLNQRSCRYLFYDPFDAPDYVFIKWSNMERQDFEENFGVVFEDNDFERFRDNSRWPILNPARQFPHTWAVMV